MAAESPSVTTRKGSDVSADIGYFRRMLKERLLRVMTILSSRASHPIAHSKMGPFPSTSFLSCASESSPWVIKSVPNGPSHLADVFLCADSDP